MPKYTKRIQSYQIKGGGHLNEFEFQQDQDALAQSSESPFANEVEQTNTDPAARIAEVTAAAHRKVEKRKRLGLAPSGGGTKGAARKGSSKKVAKKATKSTKKPAKRTAAKKRASTSGASKRSAKKATKTPAKKKPNRPAGKNRKS
jgi:hypothetical protein